MRLSRVVGTLCWDQGVDDLICILLYRKAPLHFARREQFHVVGECYIHKITDREAIGLVSQARVI